MNYKCNDCGHAFDEPVKTVAEDHSEVGYWPEYEYDCPYCGSTNFSEAFECSECGKTESTDKWYPGEICDECAHKLQHKFEMVFFGFSQKQRDCIRFFIEEHIV